MLETLATFSNIQPQLQPHFTAGDRYDFDTRCFLLPRIATAKCNATTHRPNTGHTGAMGKEPEILKRDSDDAYTSYIIVRLCFRSCHALVLRDVRTD